MTDRYRPLTDQERYARNEAILDRLRHRHQRIDGPTGVAREFQVTPSLVRRLRRARKGVMRGAW